MLILLSPAKTMDTSENGNIPSGTFPQFGKEAHTIASHMSGYSRDQLQLLLQISNKLTDINYKRFQQFDSPSTPQKPAILAYTGTVFQHLQPYTFSPEDYRYAQDHLRIVSTLYGLLRPLDLIKAYRIAYKLKIKGMPEKDLYEYWKPRLTIPLIEAVRESGGILINLASLDIQGALEMDKLEKEIRLVTPEFKEFRNGKYETIRTYAKMARGEMARYLLLNRFSKPKDLQKFEWNHFRYIPQLSDESHYIFTKQK